MRTPCLFAGAFAGVIVMSSCAEEPDGGPAAEPDYAAQRRAMVANQLVARGIESEAVLEAMSAVPRHEFVPQAVRTMAYADRPLPIGHGQTISQPYIVAFMSEILAPASTDRVLEVGTGSGYQAAVLAELVAEVWSIEIVEPLAEGAMEVLGRLGLDNVKVKAGDGYRGWPEHAPFDAVIVTCAPDHVPAPLIEQLKNGGSMIIPIGEPYSSQHLVLFKKQGDRLIERAVLPVRFVPMTGESQKAGGLP